MKILLGITKSNLGGAQRYVLDLATEFANQGHSVGVVCGGKGLLVDKLQREKIFPQIIPNLGRDISIKQDLKSFLKLIKLLSSSKPDVFHINSSKIGVMGSLAGRLTRVNKIIFTSHGWAFNEPGRSPFEKRIIKFLYWVAIMLSHKTICVSEQLKKDIAGFPGIKNKVVVIYNGIKPFDLLPREEAREKLIPKILASTMLVAAFSELHKIKGLDILLEAWKKFIEGKNAKLIIAGTGEERVHLHNMASHMGILESVYFTDYLDGARSYLSGIDIFIIPSRSEGLPYALLEAGLTGKPTIASNVGGIPEIIKNKVNGILVEPENSSDLTDALTVLYDNPVDRGILGMTLKETIELKFSQETMVKKTLEIYVNAK